MRAITFGVHYRCNGTPIVRCRLIGHACIGARNVPLLSLPPGGKVIRSIAEVVKGWVYLLALVTGGNYLRKAKLQRLGKGTKILPTVFFKYPEMIQIGDNSFINHLCSVWASPGGPITIGCNVLLGPCASIISSNHGIARGDLIRNQPGQERPSTLAMTYGWAPTSWSPRESRSVTAPWSEPEPWSPAIYLRCPSAPACPQE